MPHGQNEHLLRDQKISGRVEWGLMSSDPGANGTALRLESD